MEQQFDPAVGQVRNGCVFASVHTVDARYFHSADAGSGQGLELGSKIRAIDRAAHPPPAGPRLGFGGRRGPCQVRGLSHGDVGQEKQGKKRPREPLHHAWGLVSSIQKGALANHSTVPTSISAAWVAQAILPANTKKDGTTVSPRPAMEITLSRVRMVTPPAPLGPGLAVARRSGRGRERSR